MIRRLFTALRLRFGLRHGTQCRPSQTCARRNRRPSDFKLVRGDDGCDYVVPNNARVAR